MQRSGVEMLNSFFSPLRFGILFALLVVLTWRWLPRWMRALTLVPLLACALMTLPWVANAMIGWQEGRTAVSETCLQSPPQVVVVLSGGISRQPTDETDFSALGESSLRRLIGAVDRLRQQPDAKLVISGGSTVYGVGEGALMRVFAERLGVARESMMLEGASHSTWQNAQFVRVLEPNLPSRIWLVTSAVHMPRSQYAFEQAGFEVCAWPVDTRYARANSIGYYLPSTKALAKSDAVLREWFGEAAYRLGWFRSTTRNPWAHVDER